jgi:Malonate decarboxylase gamma subunit (MdcE)/Carboxyl transferase domain
MSQLLNPLKDATGFTPFGDVIGNLTLGKGRIGQQAVQVALVENRIASGSLGLMECNKLAQLFRLAARDSKPLILYLDSAGARVSQGLPALGAFRHLFRAAMDLAASNTPVVTVLGTHCYGGASMLAHLGRQRLFAQGTQLAMSGPAILAQAAGSSPLDDMFKAIAQASISAEARSKVTPANRLVGHPVRAFEESLTAPAINHRERHAVLGERLGKLLETASRANALPVQSKPLQKLFKDQYSLSEVEGVVSGTAQFEDREHDVLGLVGGKSVSAVRAWMLAEAAWNRAADKPLLILLDADSHSARIDDEKIVLSEYLFDLAMALRHARPACGIVLGTSGGGSFVSVSAACERLALVRGAQIQVLPGAAIASILGENKETEIDFGEVKRAGAADEEIKLGLVPGMLEV